MTKSELRIGNIIQGQSDLPETVIELKENGGIKTYRGNVKHLHLSSIAKYCSPIPITEKWLLDFGFVQFQEEMRLQLREYLFLVFDTCQFGVFVESTDSEDKSSILFDHIKYVHQIQNLYFSLTGKELN